jgi:HD superfamily phosphohydrolase YqeK
MKGKDVGLPSVTYHKKFRESSSVGSKLISVSDKLQNTRMFLIKKARKPKWLTNLNRMANKLTNKTCSLQTETTSKHTLGSEKE